MLKQDIQPVAGEGTFNHFIATQETAQQGWSAPQYSPTLEDPLSSASNILQGQLVPQCRPLFYSMLYGATSVIQGVPASIPQSVPGYSRAMDTGVGLHTESAYAGDSDMGISYMPKLMLLRNPAAYIQARPIEGVILLVLTLFMIVVIAKAVQGKTEKE